VARLWTLKRLALSAFVTAHIAAVILWNMPECALKSRLAGWTAYYFLPSGQWQCWDMFSPDPLRDTVELEALVRDSRGRLHRFAFPRLADKSVLEAAWGYRHPKYAASLASEGCVLQREYAARYVLRKLGLAPDAYPADIELYYNVRPTPLPGAPADEPSLPPEHITLQTYRFPSFEETLP
jgi:hypothetical protein